MSEEENISFKEIQSFLKKNPDLYNVLKDSKKRGALAFFFREDSDRIDYLMKNPWIDLEKIVKTADGIMNISPDIQDEDLLNILCRDAAVLTNAKSATCRTYDPIKIPWLPEELSTGMLSELRRYLMKIQYLDM